MILTKDIWRMGPTFYLICALDLPQCAECKIKFYLCCRVKILNEQYDQCMQVYRPVLADSNCTSASKVPFTDTPGTPRDPLQHGSAAADLITSAFVPFGLAWRQRHVQQNSSSWRWGLLCSRFYLAGKGNYLMVKITAKKTLWVHFNVAVESQKEMKIVLDPPFRVTCQHCGATHAYMLNHTQGCVQGMNFTGILDMF